MIPSQSERKLPWPRDYRSEREENCEGGESSPSSRSSGPCGSAFAVLTEVPGYEDNQHYQMMSASDLKPVCY